jgi:hypothetical protein
MIMTMGKQGECVAGGSLRLGLNDLMTMRSKVNDNEWINDKKIK